MARVLLRDVPDEVIARLKDRARRNKRSLQAELRLVIERGAAAEPDFRKLAARVRKDLAGGKHSDSTTLIRSDRRR